jgi:DNA-binding transcriptional MerR regulator
MNKPKLKPFSPRKKQSRSYYLRNRAKVMEKQRLYRANNKERLASQHRARKYGMSEDEFHSLLSLQQGRCAICGTINFGGRGYQVDHNHQTGKVRGILCFRCNTAIGFIDESMETVGKIIAYLEQGEENE